MFAQVTKLVLIHVFIQCASSFDSRNVVFTIVSQSEPYHASVATRLKKDIESQVLQLEGRHPKIHLTHEDFPVSGAWTIIPLLGPITARYSRSEVRWVLFVESHTAVRCGKLLEALAAADEQPDTMWIGYPLSDEEPTIIHHFTFYEDLEDDEDDGFVYPNFASGFAMRMELIFKLLNQIESGQRKLEADFSIDPAFELAQLVYGDEKEPGPLLTPDLSFCIVSGDNCATYPRQFDICGSAVPEESIFFAVKTWSGYHATRAKVVKKTWGRHVTNLMFYSDKDDPSLPAVNTGVTNSKTGHCVKTVAILKQVVQRIRHMPWVQWIFLADDDTILGRHPKIHLTHEDFPVSGAWTIIPLLGPLTARYMGSEVRWVLFVESHTAVRCGKLLEALAAADEQPDTMWIGYPLSDEEPTIIHHFTFYEDLEDDEDDGFVYPNFASGFAMRMELIFKLLNQIESGQRKLEADFSIDPAFELAQLVYGDEKEPGPLLTPDLSFCIVSGDNCATYPRQFDICGSAVPEESIFFAVKTWSGYHATRAKVVKKTWGRHVTNLMFYSDKDDPSLPAVNTGVTNSKTGHCVKTVAILKQVVQRIRHMPWVQWIFLADDDTILGVQRLCEVLSCYRGGDNVTLLGERYGYGYGKKETAAKGYDYITGGGGTVLSVGAARLAASCACGSLAAPDDMTLGACAAHRLNITLVHSPLFHQVRPQDYAREVLGRDRPVSFHRHSSPEPTRVYATWFQHDDLALKRRPKDEL